MKKLLVTFLSFIPMFAFAQKKANVLPKLDILIIYMDSLQIEHKEVVLAQAIYESGWFNCKNCCLKYNNLFGFMSKKGYLKFKSWRDACVYYKYWQLKTWAPYKKGQKNADYFKFLMSRASGPYSRSSIYDKEIKRVVEWLKTNYLD